MPPAGVRRVSRWDAVEDLRAFQGKARLFPLPGVILFPHVVLPLHIFEPRYRQMVRHAMESDRLIGLIQPLPTAAAVPGQDRELLPIGCLGLVIGHDTLPDGRSNLLLHGVRRFRLLRENPRRSLYREADVELLDDEMEDRVGGEARRALIRRFQTVLDRAGTRDPDIDALLRSDISVGALTDIMAYALGLPHDWKQAMLNETNVPRRVDQLLDALPELQPDGFDDDRDDAFPNFPFSPN